MVMDMWNVPKEFGQWYSDAMNKAAANDDWEERNDLHREAKRIISQMTKLVAAVDMLQMYGIKS
jgi:tripartite-type tricarboxylate transporter receptor subunit TctC